MKKKKLRKEHLPKLSLADQMLLLMLRNKGPQTKLQLLQVMSPDIFKRLCNLSVLEEVPDPLGISVLYKVKDELGG